MHVSQDWPSHGVIAATPRPPFVARSDAAKSGGRRMTAVLSPSVAPSARRARIDADAAVDRGVRTVTGLLIWAGLLLVTFWWDADGGITDLAGWESGLTSIGRLTGLWSADLLLVQVLLMSRLPPLEHAFGRDRLARIHRVTGFLSFDLMLVHIVTIVLGYAGASWWQVPATTWDLVTTYGGVLLALAGTACLVMVVVTSVKKARRRLRYESWHLLHLYAYLGVGLALPHQLWTGQEFLRSPGATLYWWSLWIAAAAAILLWRVVLPLARSLRYRLRVTSVVRESADVVSVHLSGRRIDRMPVRAGQFLNVRFLDGPGWTRANPYSLSAAPDGRSLRSRPRPWVTAAPDGPSQARHPRLSKDPTVGSAAAPGPDRVAPDRGRRRHHPDQSAGRGAADGHGEAVLLHRYTDEPLFATELRPWSRAGTAVLSLPGRRTRPDSARPSSRRTSYGLCSGGFPTSLNVTSSSAGRPSGPSASSSYLPQQGCRPTTFTPRPLDGDLVRRIVLWLASTITVVVLLFGYHTSTNTPATSSSVPTATHSGSAGHHPKQLELHATPTPTPSASASPSTVKKSYLGQVAETRWGPVQVKITVADGTITDVTVPQSPSGNPRDYEINNQALPILIQETIDAQSAKIDMVSGATVTSDGYLQSLQSALDAAGI